MRKSQIRKFLGSVRYRKSAKFLDVQVRESQIRNFYILSANRKSANFFGVPVCGPPTFALYTHARKEVSPIMSESADTSTMCHCRFNFLISSLQTGWASSQRNRLSGRVAPPTPPPYTSVSILSLFLSLPALHRSIIRRRASLVLYNHLQYSLNRGRPLEKNCISTCLPHPPTLPTQSNDWYWGPTELVQHFAFRESSHGLKGAARHIIDMVWLYSSPIPCSGEERRGVF